MGKHGKRSAGVIARVTLIGAMVCAVAGAVTACTAPTVVPTQTPSATPTTRIASVVISAEAITINSRDTSVDGFSYFLPTAGTVDALTAVFGEEPTVGILDAGIESYPGVTYTWPGIEIIDSDFPSDPVYEPEYRVSVTSAELNGVLLTTVGGVQVGDSTSDLESSFPGEASRSVVNGGAERLDVMLGTIDLPQEASYPANEPQRTFSVWVSTTDPAGSVDTIAAPWPNFGI